MHGTTKTFFVSWQLFSHMFSQFECWWEILRNANKFTRKKAMLVLVVLSTMIAATMVYLFVYPFSRNSMRNEMNEERYKQTNNSIQISLTVSIDICSGASLPQLRCIGCVYKFFVQIMFDLNQFIETCESSFMEMWIWLLLRCCCCYQPLHWYARMDRWIIFSFLACVYVIKKVVFFCINFDTVLINV